MSAANAAITACLAYFVIDDERRRREEAEDRDTSYYYSTPSSPTSSFGLFEWTCLAFAVCFPLGALAAVYWITS